MRKNGQYVKISSFMFHENDVIQFWNDMGVKYNLFPFFLDELLLRTVTSVVCRRENCGKLVIFCQNFTFDSDMFFKITKKNYRSRSSSFCL